MTLEAYPPRTTEPELYATIVRILGTGAATPTKVLGKGVTVSYISTGLYEITWAENPGIFCGLAGSPSFEATTAADVKGFTAVPGTYNTSTLKLRVSVTGASESLTDLAALQWLTLIVLFKRNSA